MGGGPGAKVDGGRHDAEKRRECASAVRPVFPVREVDGAIAHGNDDEFLDELCAPCGEEEQVETPLCLPSVYQPTRSEYLDHCITHYPFRVWCKHCLEGRGREFAHEHHRGDKDARSIPVISFDYCFISDVGDVTTGVEFEAAGDGVAKVLVVRDGKSKCVFAHVVPAKGVDEAGFAVATLVDDVKWLGYNKIALKSDNERAIVKLLSEALRELRISGLDQCLEEHPPEYDPQSNGSAEIGVKLLKGHLRTLKSCLESRIGHKIPVQHPVVAWMTRHAANLITWYAKGHDGRTGYQRAKTRDFRTRLMGFGEFCRFKNRSHEPIANVNGGTRFHSGVFLGIDQRTGQYMVYSDNSIKLARTVVRVPESEKWCKESRAGVKVTPHSLHVPQETEVIFKDKAEVEKNDFTDKAIVSRNVYLRASDFEEHGTTRGCAKCDHYRMTMSWVGHGKPHSAVCRKRITEAIASTEAGRIRIGAATDRLDKTVEALGQQFRSDVPQGENVADVVQHQPEQTVPQFIPMPAGQHEPVHQAPSGDAGVDFESREVPPSPDEPGIGETREMRSEDEPYAVPLCPDGQEIPGMEVDLVEETDNDLKAIMAVMRRDEKAEIQEANAEMMAVIRSLGGDHHRYGRERRKALKAVVSEIYSPPRVTAAIKLLPELRLIPGFALDLTTADSDGKLWDFDSKVMRERAMKRVKEERPLLLVGSPMCTAFSTWQRINNLLRCPVTVAAEKKRAVEHLRFCVAFYREQMIHGRYFLHEHPAYASSWQDEEMKKLMSEAGVVQATADQCQYGSQAPDGSPVKKPTTFLTNSPELAKELSTRCSGKKGECSRPGGGTHTQCRGKVARAAAIYHFKLCRAILVGFRNQLKVDGCYKDGFVGLLERNQEQEELPMRLPLNLITSKERDLLPIHRLTDAKGFVLNVRIEDDTVYRDDLTGQVLDATLVRAARAKEMEYFEAKVVWEVKDMGEARRVTGKPPVTVR